MCCGSHHILCATMGSPNRKGLTQLLCAWGWLCSTESAVKNQVSKHVLVGDDGETEDEERRRRLRLAVISHARSLGFRAERVLLIIISAGRAGCKEVYGVPAHPLPLQKVGQVRVVLLIPHVSTAPTKLLCSRLCRWSRIRNMRVVFNGRSVERW